MLVAMRILRFARVKPKVSEKTKDAPSGNTLLRLLFLLNFQSVSACNTWSSVTNVPLLNMEAAYSSALFLQRAGSTRNAGRNFFARILFSRSVPLGDELLTIFGQEQEHQTIVLEMRYDQVTEGRVPAAIIDYFSPRSLRYGVPRQLAQWGALRGRCGEAIVVDGLCARHR